MRLILDDEVLGAGGTLAKLARAGHELQVLFLTDGVGSRFVGHLQEHERLIAVENRSAAALRAANVLGLFLSRRHVIGTEPFVSSDNAMDASPLLNVVRAISSELDSFHPDVVYTNSITDLNIDHRRTAEAGLVATRPVPGTPGAGVRVVYSFEVPSSTEWAFGQLGTFRPTVFECLGGVDWETKEKALDCYADELRPYPHPRSKEVLKAVAQVRGAMVGVGLAEAFEVIRDVRE